MACSRAGGDCADRIRGPSYVGRGFFIDAAVLPPHRLISAEGGDAAATQPGISDRPTFFSHAVGSEVAIGAEQVVVLVALPYVLCGDALLRFGAACAETAAKAAKPISVGKITRISASLFGGNVRQFSG